MNRPPTIHPDVVAERLGEVRARIAGLAGDRTVEIVAVTKGFGSDAVRAAATAGCSMVGENYAQEVTAKFAELVDLPGRVDGGGAGIALHFIGRLQSNKIRQLAPLVDVWESVDRSALLDGIAKRRPGATVLIQVNATGESGKGGCDPGDVGDLVRHGVELGLDVDGLMTVGPTDGDPAATRIAFEAVRTLATTAGLPTCSMGMTHDLDIAVACGSTRVRVGTALFGPRPRWERPVHGPSGPIG